LTAVVLLCAWTALAAPLDRSSGTISVEVTGLRSDKGLVRAALFSSKESFDRDRKAHDGASAFRRAAVPIESRRALCVFQGVPFGTYAVKLFHDEAGSGRLPVGALGVPKAEYGFSNNARGILSPPGFEKAAFELRAPEIRLAIEAR
jgi:uncharacterized protein (DUF2141 family)